MRAKAFLWLSQWAERNPFQVAMAICLIGLLTIFAKIISFGAN